MSEPLKRSGRPRNDNDAIVLLALSFIYGGYYQVEKKLGWGNQKRVRNRIKRMLEKHGHNRPDLLELKDIIERCGKAYNNIFERWKTGELAEKPLDNSSAPLKAIYAIHASKLYVEDKEILKLADKALKEINSELSSSFYEDPEVAHAMHKELLRLTDKKPKPSKLNSNN
ncbi:hypothetical protein [Vibrio tasmaniensis]|uniref:hypothetical protein n=1 Tax=Vibrio tasmaniensis TaxID=212663 RepID=UPI00107EEB4D|nr:hypothetical protein [Vibrio tasmaniensis]